MLSLSIAFAVAKAQPTLIVKTSLTLEHLHFFVIVEMLVQIAQTKAG